MGGRMGLAIEHTLRSYPGLLENNQNLLFMLKCRQFVEMVNGSDFEVCVFLFKWMIRIFMFDCLSIFPSQQNNLARSATNPVQTSVIQSTKSYQNGSQLNSNGNNTNNINNNNNSSIITDLPIPINDNPDLNNTKWVRCKTKFSITRNNL